MRERALADRVGCSGPGAAWGEMGEVFGMLAVCLGIRDQEVPLSLWPIP
jgi:hypothetical protein